MRSRRVHSSRKVPTGMGVVPNTICRVLFFWLLVTRHWFASLVIAVVMEVLNRNWIRLLRAVGLLRKPAVSRQEAVTIFRTCATRDGWTLSASDPLSLFHEITPFRISAPPPP